MKNKLLKFFSILILLGTFGSIAVVKAQSLQDSILTLKNCIDLTIKNSYQLKSDSLLSESMQMIVKQEQSAYYPQISGGAGISRLFLSPYSFGQHYLQAIADWDFGKFWYKTSAIHQKQIERQEAINQQNILEITSVVTGLYLDVQQIELELDVLNSRLDYLNQHLNILTVLWKAGTQKQLDVLQTQSSINSNKEAILQKEIEAEQAKYALARLAGFNADSEFKLKPITGLGLPYDILLENGDTLVQNHPALLTIQKEYEAELLKKIEVKAAYLPHIQALSGYTFDGDPSADGNFAMIGLGATIPIYQWNKNNYRLREINYASEAIQAKKNNAERELLIRYTQIVKQIKQYQKIIDFQQIKIETDKKAAQVAELNYKAGVSSNLDYLMAQQNLAETEMQINAMQNRYLKSIIALYLITGETEKIKNIK